MAVSASKLSDIISGEERSAVEAILETTPSIAVIADAEGTILRVSRFGCELSGWDPHELEGLKLSHYFKTVRPSDPDGRLLEAHETPIARALKGEHVRGWEGFFSHRSGERIPIVVNSAPFLGRNGEVIGAITSVTDLREFKTLEHELRAAVAQKAMLYDELAHRVKNHLQVISASIRLEAGHARAAVEDMTQRIGARVNMLAAVYERIQQSETGGYIDARHFIEEIVRPYRTGSIAVETNAPTDLALSLEQAAPLGMLVNEAVCNAHKHAFPDGRGQIQVTLRRSARQLQLEVVDDGIGWEVDAASEPSQGIRLMQLQAQQLGGAMKLSNRPGGGARIVVTMPFAAAEQHQPEDPRTPERASREAANSHKRERARGVGNKAGRSA